MEEAKPGTQQPDRTRGSYEQFTAEEKARIGKRAAKHGIASRFVILIRFSQTVLLRKAVYVRGKRNVYRRLLKENMLAKS